MPSYQGVLSPNEIDSINHVDRKHRTGRQALTSKSRTLSARYYFELTTLRRHTTNPNIAIPAIIA